MKINFTGFQRFFLKEKPAFFTDKPQRGLKGLKTRKKPGDPKTTTTPEGVENLEFYKNRIAYRYMSFVSLSLNTNLKIKN
jgi:hypothetical protein